MELCCICLETLDRNIHTLLCKHQLHIECYDDLQIYNKTHKIELNCPLCVRKIEDHKNDIEVIINEIPIVVIPSQVNRYAHRDIEPIPPIQIFVCNELWLRYVMSAVFIGLIVSFAVCLYLNIDN